jgi:hypothetical protein
MRTYVRRQQSVHELYVLDAGLVRHAHPVETPQLEVEVYQALREVERAEDEQLEDVHDGVLAMQEDCMVHGDRQEEDAVYDQSLPREEETARGNVQRLDHCAQLDVFDLDRVP